MQKSSYRLLDLLESDPTKSSHELLNQSGILADISASEVPVLLNAVTSLKNDVKGNLLKKVKGSIAING